MNIIQALDDKKVFAPFFQRADLDCLARLSRRTVCSADEANSRSRCPNKFTGRATPPTTPIHEAWLLLREALGKILRSGFDCNFLGYVPRLASLSRSRRSWNDHGHMRRS